MLEIGPELPIDGYIEALEAEKVNVLGVNAPQLNEAKLITFPHGETYEL